MQHYSLLTNQQSCFLQRRIMALCYCTSWRKHWPNAWLKRSLSLWIEKTCDEPRISFFDFSKHDCKFSGFHRLRRANSHARLFQWLSHAKLDPSAPSQCAQVFWNEKETKLFSMVRILRYIYSDGQKRSNDRLVQLNWQSVKLEQRRYWYKVVLLHQRRCGDTRLNEFRGVSCK